MAGLVPHTRQVLALLPAPQPLQRAVTQVEPHGKPQAAPRPAPQSWRRSSWRRQHRAPPPALLTAAAALSRPSVEDRLAGALNTPASRELVTELAAAVAFIESTGASVNMAFLLAKEAGRLPPDQCRTALATLQPKFELFQQRCAAAADACDYLTIALVGCPNTQAALSLPPADFEAVLDFIESQAALLPRFVTASSRASPDGLGMAAAAATAAAAAAAGASPAAADALAADASAAAAAAADGAPASRTILDAFFKWQSLMAGALLQQHPGPYLQRTAPWLREQLGWSDVDVATAALLSARMPQLCELDTSLAQRSLDWLLAQGFSRQQAGQLLLASLRRPDGDLLTASPAQLAERQQRVVQLAAHWRVPPGLAAALWLTQENFWGSVREEDISRLLAVLRDEAGMTNEQLLDFALTGGLRGEQAANGAALDAALARLKRLLLVCGSWQGVAAALQQRPELLFAGEEAVEGLLPEPAQQAMWRVVAAMESGG